MTDNRKLNSFIDCSSNVELIQEDGFWFNRPNQRKLTYTLARDLLLNEELEPQAAIDMAVEFHNRFYDTVIRFDKD